MADMADWLLDNMDIPDPDDLDALYEEQEEKLDGEEKKEREG